MPRTLRWDVDCLMLGVRQGHNVTQFIGDINDELTTDEDMEKLAASKTATELFEILNTTMIKTGQKYYGVARKTEDAGTHAEKTMHDLSKKRIKVRQQSSKTEASPFAEILKQEVREIAKQYRNTKRNHEQKLQDIMDEEITEAAQNNDMALVWRLSKRRSGKKLGPKHRG